MIYVDELDSYLRSYFYYTNYRWYLEYFKLSNKLESWRNFLINNRSIFTIIANSADEFGFLHEVGTVRGMNGERDITTSNLDNWNA